MVERLRLDGRVVVVIGGGGGGLGTETSLALADAGAKVSVVELTEARARDAQEQISISGGEALVFEADVRDVDAVSRALEGTVAQWGRLDGLVNVVGGSRMERRDGREGRNTSTSTILDFSSAAYEDILAVNLHYVFHSCKFAAAHMMRNERGGTIVNFGSVSGLAASPFNVAYGLSKAAVVSLTRTVAVELGTYGIRANCIVPSSVRTPLIHASAPAAGQEMDRRTADKNPLGRRVRPDEVAGVVLFLLSDLSSAVTGQCLVVDAGVSANHPLGTYAEFVELAKLRRDTRR